MSENKSRGISSQDFFVKQKTREEIIKEISDTESPPAEAVKKFGTKAVTRVEIMEFKKNS